MSGYLPMLVFVLTLIGAVGGIGILVWVALALIKHLRSDIRR